MNVKILIPEDVYESLRKHLFKGSKEEGAFLFATDSVSSSEIILRVEDTYLIPFGGWNVQEPCYLELSEEEKVKIMIMARNRNCNLIECHSHRSPYGMAYFSPSDILGLEQFINYVRWKLPGKKYGALVWTKSSVYGQIWAPNNPTPIPVKEVCIIKKDGTSRAVRPSARKDIFSCSAKLFKRGGK